MLGWRESIVGNVRATLILLLGAVTLVLLIACTNVANLVLARSIARRQELTVRTALGAGRGRLARQILAENMLIGSLGAVLGLGLASMLVRGLPTLGPIGVPRLKEVTLDRAVVTFAAGMGIITGLGVGVWPLQHLGYLDLVRDLNESARFTTAGKGQLLGR